MKKIFIPCIILALSVVSANVLATEGYCPDPSTFTYSYSGSNLVITAQANDNNGIAWSATINNGSEEEVKSSISWVGASAFSNGTSMNGPAQTNVSGIYCGYGYQGKKYLDGFALKAVNQSGLATLGSAWVTIWTPGINNNYYGNSNCNIAPNACRFSY